MISLLSRIFIKDRGNTSNPAVRRAYGVLCCSVGIFLNLVLFGVKFFAGTISGSIAIRADAFNNLSDAGSSIITLVGFKVGGTAPDTNHPFGHGRIEYVSGLCVSIAIIMMGLELGKTSVGKVLHPQSVEFSLLSVGILVLAILVKLYMFFYNSRVGKKLNSPGMTATAADSISDVVTTSVVLAATLFTRYTGVNVDGWCGVAVAVFILWSGVKAAKDTISPLLGQPPSQALVDDIESTVMAHPEILNIHDLIVHDYGPGRTIISLHGEVPGDGSIGIMELHDVIDRIESELNEKFNCVSIIHMDPISFDDKKVSAKRKKVAALAASIDERITIHDFRMVEGPTHTNLIFDMVVPQRFPMSDKAVSERMQALVRETWSSCQCVINVDKPYV